MQRAGPGKLLLTDGGTTELNWYRPSNQVLRRGAVAREHWALTLSRIEAVLNKPFDHEFFRVSLLRWWEDNQRSYPWRATRDPYRILVAETLLHRTRADQVVKMYERFLERFPDVHALARTDSNEVHELLYSAGLRWRVNLLLTTAREIESRLDGEIPENREELESLPGVGPYIAAAIRCFAYGYPDAILDTNTVRIASRVFGFTMTDSSRRSRHVHTLLDSLVDPSSPREFNLALLDLGALICRPRNPLCAQCPVQPLCEIGRRRISDQV